MKGLFLAKEPLSSNPKWLYPTNHFTCFHTPSTTRWWCTMAHCFGGTSTRKPKKIEISYIYTI